MIKIDPNDLSIDNFKNITPIFEYQGAKLWDTRHGYVFKNTFEEYFIMSKEEASTWIFQVVNTPSISSAKNSKKKICG